MATKRKPKPSLFRKVLLATIKEVIQHTLK